VRKLEPAIRLGLDIRGRLSHHLSRRETQASESAGLIRILSPGSEPLGVPNFVPDHAHKQRLTVASDCGAP
jgi:hypothetical protein